ncbi:hypothetical protein [Emticicia fluvialis]|uniref:hypothetical protein n=1 Tax=Emticicia fluvialis TaxID=2974474 RepID=UPI002166AC73|nr:hypothetical protein [Emticicia fluvialis]
MTLFRTFQPADFEQMLYQRVKITQRNKVSIRGKILDVIPDETNGGLHKIAIQQDFICSGKVGKIVRESRLAVGTVYLSNVAQVEMLEQ